MKTKSLILLGIIIAVVSFVVVAGNKDVPSFEHDPASTNIFTKQSNMQLTITADMEVLMGRGFFYSDNGILYKRTYLSDGTIATVSKKVAEGAIRLVDQNKHAVLFIKDLIIPIEGLSGYKNELWYLDKKTGSVWKMFDDVSQEVDISPSGNLVVVRNTNSELLILSKEGDIVEKIGIHGGSPVFSPDESKVAYIKMSDKPISSMIGLPGIFQGVSVYDLLSKTDRLILPSSQKLGESDWNILAWLPDGTRIYFLSEKNNAVWSVAVDGSDRRQETNKTEQKDKTSIVLGHLLFVDNNLAFGVSKGLWRFSIGNDGEFVNVKHIIKKDFTDLPRLTLVENGKSLVLRTDVYNIYDLISR